MTPAATATATALVLEAPRRLVPRELPLPSVGDDDGLLRVEACGLCGTDHEQYTGHLPADFAFIPGHEAVGIIEDVGDRAAERWGVRVVLGPGIRGLSACVAAKEAGAAFVAITGVGPRDRGRLELAAQFGADLAVDVSVDNPAKAVRAATGGGLADVVVDVTAKAPGALAQGVAMTRPGGTLVLAGTRGSADTPGFWPDHIVYKELHLVGALGVNVTAYRAAIDVLVSRRWPFQDLPRTCAGFGDAEALLRMMAGEIEGEAPVHAVLVPDSTDTCS